VLVIALLVLAGRHDDSLFLTYAAVPIRSLPRRCPRWQLIATITRIVIEVLDHVSGGGPGTVRCASRTPSFGRATGARGVSFCTRMVTQSALYVTRQVRYIAVHSPLNP
jgi:hypothetical protein